MHHRTSLTASRKPAIDSLLHIVREQPHLVAGAVVLLLLVVLVIIYKVWRSAAQRRQESAWEEQREQLIAAGNRETSGDLADRLTTWASAMMAEERRLHFDAPLAEALVVQLLRAGKLGEIESFVGRMARVHPPPAWLPDVEIHVLVAKKGGDARALERILEGCRRRPERKEWARRAVAMVLVQGNPSPQALQFLADQQRTNADAKVQAFLADVYERKKVFNDKTQPYFAGMVEREPKVARWHYGLARCRGNRRDWAGAESALKEALTLDPGFAAAHEFRAVLETTQRPVGSEKAIQSNSPVPGRPSGTTPAGGSVTVDGAAIGLPARYRRVVELGRGGMGVVYRAHDEVLKRAVAIKTLNEQVAAAQPDLRERFLAESRTLAALDHPSIPKVFDVAVHPPCYLAFEFIEGMALREVIASGIPDLEKMLTAALELAQGFQHALDRGVLHRDIKPENILIEASGRARIVDFGLAHVAGQSTLTQAGVVVGTPWYLAPERLRGGPATSASEVYAFGVTLYEMLCGMRPFLGDDVSVVFAQEPRPLRELRPDCPQVVEALVLDCLNKNPNNRPATFTEIGREIESGLAEVRAGGA